MAKLDLMIMTLPVGKLVVDEDLAVRMLCAEAQSYPEKKSKESVDQIMKEVRSWT